MLLNVRPITTIADVKWVGGRSLSTSVPVAGKAHRVARRRSAHSAFLLRTAARRNAVNDMHACDRRIHRSIDTLRRTSAATSTYQHRQGRCVSPDRSFFALFAHRGPRTELRYANIGTSGLTLASQRSCFASGETFAQVGSSRDLECRVKFPGRERAGNIETTRVSMTDTTLHPPTMV